jgi:hypothetical protein
MACKRPNHDLGVSDWICAVSRLGLPCCAVCAVPDHEGGSPTHAGW